MNRYIIVCDESTKKGKDYSYFYGGAIVAEEVYAKINDVLKVYKESKFLAEIKRVHITSQNYNDYVDLMDLFFTYVKSGAIKVRVMFSKNDELDRIPKSENETFSKFYYLFIRYAFSIFYAKNDIDLRLIFDDLPETKDATAKFKNYLTQNLNLLPFPNANRVSLIAKDIEEVDSKKHFILQCVDVIVGLVDFALNSSIEERNSKRGFAKWQVWQCIYGHILEIHDDMILFDTTMPLYSPKGWKDVYKHFVFKNKNKTPAIPT